MMDDSRSDRGRGRSTRRGIAGTDAGILEFISVVEWQSRIFFISLRSQTYNGNSWSGFSRFEASAPESRTISEVFQLRTHLLRNPPWPATSFYTYGRKPKYFRQFLLLFSKHFCACLELFDTQKMCIFNPLQEIFGLKWAKERFLVACGRFLLTMNIFDP